MGNGSSVDPSRELEAFRAMRQRYEALKEAGKSEEQIYNELKSLYEAQAQAAAARRQSAAGPGTAHRPSAGGAAAGEVSAADYKTLLPSWVKMTPNITDEHARLVQENVAAIGAGTAFFKTQTETDDPLMHFGIVFYAQLFEVAPGVKPLFKQPMNKQGRHLAVFLKTAVGILKKPDELVPALQSVAKRHVRYGAKVPHYFVVGEVLLFALEKITGAEGWTPELAAAWLEVYSTMMHVIIPEAIEAEKAAATGAPVAVVNNIVVTAT